MQPNMDENTPGTVLWMIALMPCIQLEILFCEFFLLEQLKKKSHLHYEKAFRIRIIVSTAIIQFKRFFLLLLLCIQHR